MEQSPPGEQGPATAVIATAARRQSAPPVFISGSILRHILTMTGAGAVGLMAIFASDLANIYFLARYGDEATVAAIGYASSIIFFSTSIGIGLSIAATSLVSPAIGAGLRVRARRLSANAHVLSFAVSAALSVVLWLLITPMLHALGAEGRAFDLAARYLAFLLPTLPLLSMGMTSAAVLRSVGDARRAMNITLAGAVVSTVLDVVLIVYLGWGIDGAAVATIAARLAIMLIGLWGVVSVHRLMGRPKPATFMTDAAAFSAIALPAVLTNIATPAGNAYVTAAMSEHGDSAVSAWAIIGRIIPVAFGAIYALSGSVGPVLGQNYGAGQFERMRGVLTVSLLTAAAFTAVAWIVLALAANQLAMQFNATGEGSDLIVFFSRWLSPMFVFLGALFVANAVFNTLGHAHYSTVLNWLRATIGTVPFVMVGAELGQAKGILTGNMIGGVGFGMAAVYLAYRLIDKLRTGRIQKARRIFDPRDV